MDVSRSGLYYTLRMPLKDAPVIEASFNGKFRDECLSIEWFRNRLEARVIIEGWRRHYNEIRPHSSLNYLTPRQFMGTLNQDLTTQARISSPHR